MFKIYVGNLSFKTSDDELRALFAEHGEVTDVAVVMDRETGRSRGFAFVTMGDADQGRNAIEKLNGLEYGGRTLTINEARPKAPGGGGGYGGGYGGGGGGRGGGRGGDRGSRRSDW